MFESHIDKELGKKIDLYVNGQLSHEEIEELWAELIQDEDHLDYLKTVANAKSVIESNRKKPKIFSLNQSWTYAAAAAIAILIGVLTVFNVPSFQTNDIEPIANIELDYYRSEEGIKASENNREVLRNAVTLANSGNTQEAINVLEEELLKAEDASWIAELHLNIGSLYYNAGDYSLAVESFEQVVDKESVDILTREKGYWYLGNSYFQLNELDKAEAAIQKAYDLNGAYRRVAESYLNALASR